MGSLLLLFALLVVAAVVIGGGFALVMAASRSGGAAADMLGDELDRDDEQGEDDPAEPEGKGPRDWSKDGFVLRRTLLTTAEQDFQRTLVRAVDGGALIMAQVSLEALVRARRGAPAGVRGRLRRTVDFVLCDPATTAPRLVIELDDSSHRQRARQQRDASMEQILTSAKLPLLRVAWSRQYDPADLRQRIQAACGIAPAPLRPVAPATHALPAQAVSAQPAPAQAIATPLAAPAAATAPATAPVRAPALAETNPASDGNGVRTFGQPTSAGRRVGIAATPRPRE